MIVPLGSWVLRTACRLGGSWRRKHPDHDELFLSVNISPQQLLRAGFVDEVAGVLTETGVRPTSLVLEITENVFIEDFNAVTERLQAIRQLGVKVALDDFGSGFSSLGYLSQLPIDVLKLDRRFVTQLGEPSERGLLSGIVGLTHSLSLVAIAEGVETREQLEELRLAGCERAQGTSSPRR